MKQIPLRLPDDLVPRIDARVATVNAGKPPDEALSRNDWLIWALNWVLDKPVTTRTTKQQV